MDQLRQIPIGSIRATINGDQRYASVVRVTYLPDQDLVAVTRHETTATGGMDGLGGTNAERETFRKAVKVVDPVIDAPPVIRAIRESFDDVVKAYGRPQKRFGWPSIGYGVNIDLAVKALERALAKK